MRALPIFVVRLNPDPRDGRPYSEYPTVQEYKKIQKSAPMDGFHEALNFLPESGSVKGYLPPKFLLAMKSPEPFFLITITAKTAKNNGDQVIGIQAACRYIGKTQRTGGRSVIKKLDLTYHYSCPSSLSLLFDSPLPGARDYVMETGRNWGQGPAYEIRLKATAIKIIKTAINKGCIQQNDAKLKRILGILSDGSFQINSEFEGDSTYGDEVEEIIKTGWAERVAGNEYPEQKEVRSYQYERDAKIAAFVLLEAKGVCYDCGQKGPFLSKRNNLPFLEVHHVMQLKHGGPDTIANVIALCPNCHRKRHHG
ncbi:MAG: HNH endonuclease [Alphaproteobacteria bacterium]|nr:HNH endonuclease [Alphaproteobacteria bacterium]